MRNRRRGPRALILSAVTAVAAGLLGTAHAVPTTSAADTRHPLSTGTSVVARQGSAGAVQNVGTSTVTVRPGTGVRQALAKLTSADRSRQTRVLVDAEGQPKNSGQVEAGDVLRVTAEDGRTTGSYALAVDQPATARDKAHWNNALYDRIDRTVNAHTPVFPDRRCDVTAAKYRPLVRQVTETYATGNEAGRPSATDSPLVYGSQQVWYYGDALNAAVKDCSTAGGGIAVVPAGGSLNADGAYYTGAVNLLSGVNLHIETGAVVEFMRDKTNEYYPVVRTSYEGSDLYSYSPLIYALHQRNIAVTGGGTLDGQEDMWNWRPWKKGYWGEPSVENKSVDAPYGANGVLNDMNYRDVPVEQRIFTDDGELPDTIPVVRQGEVRDVAPPAGAQAMKSTFRPSFIQPNDSTNVLIEDVRIRNTPFWIVHPLSSKNVLIRNLDIYSNKTTGYERTGWNNDDGIDPESSENVVMENNTVTVSDDGAAVKAGRNVNGREHRSPSQNIIIRDSSYRNDGGGSAAVSMGSEMSGGIRNVFIHDNTFGGSGLAMALKLKTNSSRGGAVENIYLRDCLLERASYGVAEFDADYKETVPFPGADAFDPTIRDIHIDNVDTAPTMPPGRTAFSFPSGASRSPVENVYYGNSVFHTSSTLSAAFEKNKNIRNLVVDNVDYVNPSTGATTRYDTTPLVLEKGTRAVRDDGTTVPLAEAGSAPRGHVTTVPDATFRVAGKVDLSTAPDFPAKGTVRLFVDRDTTPVAATLQADGSFLSDPVTLDDNQTWYTDRHYVSVNFYQGININTVVHHVRVEQSTTDGSE
ncbi:glycosyl hydrolase family 28 protein [Streptomyces sp. NPDC023723]|uniref:glycoside hydrolase family 28 protein n=1 Tax=Streptomyces sp. NPDC023723 TaxID=3154323 RepID=UPI0033E5D6BC